jgi:hypothetical protein
MKALLSKLIDDVAYIESLAEAWTPAVPGYAEMAREFTAIRDTVGFWYHYPPPMKARAAKAASTKKKKTFLRRVK